MEAKKVTFTWDPRKERINIRKHGIAFAKASRAFRDPKRKIFTDYMHGEKEQRYFCIGRVSGKIMTVRFTYRNGEIRIYGAGYWRKGKRYYEEKKD